MSTPRHVRAGTAADGPWLVAITPEQAGWAYCGLRVLDLPPGGAHAPCPLIHVTSEFNAWS